MPTTTTVTRQRDSLDGVRIISVYTVDTDSAEIAAQVIDKIHGTIHAERGCCRIDDAPYYYRKEDEYKTYPPGHKMPARN